MTQNAFVDTLIGEFVSSKGIDLRPNTVCFRRRKLSFARCRSAFSAKADSTCADDPPYFPWIELGRHQLKEPKHDSESTQCDSLDRRRCKEQREAEVPISTPNRSRRIDIRLKPANPAKDAHRKLTQSQGSILSCLVCCSFQTGNCTDVNKCQHYVD